MMRKLVVMLMAVLFSLSVSGVSFAQEKPAAKPAPSQPCAGAEKEMKKTKKAKKAQTLAEKKAACLETATTDQAKAECEKKFAEKAKKKAKKAKKDEGAATMAPEKPAAAPAKPAEPAKK